LYLNLANNELTSLGMASLNKALRVSGVTELDLSHNNLGDSGIR
jgi:Leucine Rich repeat